MKAIILAAGYGTRLYPLTKDTPKALLPIKERPLLSYTIEKIEEAEDIEEVFIVVNDIHYEKFSEWLEHNRSNFKKKVVLINDGTKKNEERLGGVRDLTLVLDNQKIQDDVLVLAGDSLFDFSLSEVVEFFNNKKEVVNAAYELDSLEEARRFGVLELNSENKTIKSFEEKPEEPKSKTISLACYIFPKEKLKYIREYADSYKEKEGVGFIIKDLIKQRKEVYAYKVEGRHFDIGVIEDYKKANEVW